jgi:hypothetical protein
MLWAVLCSSALAADEKRKTMPIGGEWNLSGTSLERTQMDGERVVQLVAKGEAKLKKGRNPLLGPWVLEASGETIECDFPGKRFIIQGPYSLRKKEGKGWMEISGPGHDSKVELAFQGGAVRADGPNKVRLLDEAEVKATAAKGERAAK